MENGRVQDCAGSIERDWKLQENLWRLRGTCGGFVVGDVIEHEKGTTQLGEGSGPFTVEAQEWGSTNSKKFGMINLQINKATRKRSSSRFVFVMSLSCSPKGYPSEALLLVINAIMPQPISKSIRTVNNLIPQIAWSTTPPRCPQVAPRAQTRASGGSSDALPRRSLEGLPLHHVHIVGNGENDVLITAELEVVADDLL